MCIQGCNVNSQVCSFELYLGNFLKNAILKTFKRFFFHIKFCFWWFLKQLFCMLHTGYRGRKAILLLRFFLHSDHIRKSYVNVYKHVYILPLYRFMHFFFFFFGFSETKQIAVVRQNHVDFFNWKVQNFRLIITTVTVWRFLKAERSYCRYFTHQLNRKKKSVMILFFIF